MTIETFASVEGIRYPVLISDEYEALSAALAAGRAAVEIIGSGPMSGAEFALERLEEADSEFLERVVRRRLNLPWKICETKRLIIREFCCQDLSDIYREEEETKEDLIFCEEERLKAYISCQYRFFQYGIWAVIRKEDGKLIGKAGLYDETEENGESRTELGYHIFSPYRRNGYAREACEGILAYADSHLKRNIAAQADSRNKISARLLESLGFLPVSQKCNEEGQCSCQYVRYYSGQREEDLL